MPEWSEESLIRSVFKNWLLSSGLSIEEGERTEITATKIWRFYVGGAPFRSLTQEQVENMLYSLLGRIVLRMDTGANVHYGIILPKNNVVERNVLNIRKETRRSLNLNFFLIDEKQRIYHLSPNADKFKEVEGL
jgi:hypothetical protein